MTLARCGATIEKVAEILTVESPVETGVTSEVTLPDSRDSRWVWLAVAVAFALRYGWVLVAHKYRFVLPTHYDFGQEMGAVARSLATGHGFGSPFPEWSGPTTWMAPLYPLLMAAVFKLFGVYSTSSALIMLGLNSAFSALTCWPIYLIARDLGNRRVAMCSAWLWALLPPFMMWAVNWVWDASLATLALTCLVLMALRMSQHANLLRWLALGALFGVTALVNPTVLSVFPIAVLYVGWFAWRRREAWVARAVGCTLVLVVAISPSLVRNYETFGKFIFVRGNFWFEVRLGNAIGADGTEMLFTHPEVNPIERTKYLTMGEQGYFDSKKREALKFIRENPRYFAELCFRRVLLFWGDYGDYNGDVADALLTIARRTFSVLALIGLLQLLFRRRRGAALAGLTVCVFPSVFYLTTPSIRYRHVLEPLLLIFTVYAVSQVKEFRKLFANDRDSTQLPALAGQ